jgi:hypothetical protein
MTKPTINVSVYGENTPAGATFGKGAKRPRLDQRNGGRSP